jgi:hypothetical protein
MIYAFQNKSFVDVVAHLNWQKLAIRRVEGAK